MEAQRNQANRPVIIEETTNQEGIPVSLQGASPNEQQVLGFPVNKKEFPVKTCKYFGRVQMALGILLGLLSITGVGLDVAETYGSDIICFFASGWFILTGILPNCMTEKRKSSWWKLKMAFMVCSIIGASSVAPLIFSFSAIEALILSDQPTAAVPAFMAFITFLEAIVTILAASFCCCCSPWRDQPQTIVIMAPQPGEFTNIPYRPTPFMDYQPTTMNARNVSGPRHQQYSLTANQQLLRNNVYHQHPYQPQINNSQPFRHNSNNQQSSQPMDNVSNQLPYQSNVNAINQQSFQPMANVSNQLPYRSNVNANNQQSSQPMANGSNQLPYQSNVNANNQQSSQPMANVSNQLPYRSNVNNQQQFQLPINNQSQSKINETGLVASGGFKEPSHFKKKKGPYQRFA